MTNLLVLQISTGAAIAAHTIALIQIVFFKKRPRARVKRRYAVLAWAIASCLIMLLGQNISGLIGGVYVMPVESLFYCWFSIIITLHRGNVARLFNCVPSYSDNEVLRCR